MNEMPRKFFLLSAFYLICTTLWVLVFVPDPVSFWKHNTVLTSFFIKSLVSNRYNMLIILLLLVIGRWLRGWHTVEWKNVLGSALFALVGTALFMAAFASVETTFVMVMPFYADHIFADMDRWLLFDRDAWELTHSYFPELGSSFVDLIYGRLWIALVFLFPTFLLLVDRNRARISRYILLYFVAFFVVGNVFALMFLSVGPVYYDTYYGMTTYGELVGALERSGVSASHIGKVQTYLGEVFFANDGSHASDVAAFPSVHVSSIMVTALYLAERSKILGALMAVFVALILFMSVYTGYHWLVDGIASIFIMIAANMWLKRSRLTKKLTG